ncbi:MAG: hypothetical protein AAFN93_11650 [Bacteroidota bacterium]
MRVFEIALLVLVTLLPFLKSWVLKVANAKLILSLLCSILFLHLVVEGWRWQMAPGYFLFIIITLVILNSKTDGKKWPIGLVLFAYVPLTALLVVSWALPYLLPVFKLPAPTGNYFVGTQNIHLKLDRPEVITPNKSDKRELSIKVWYPSGEISDHRDEYIDQGSRQGFAMKYGLPSFSMDYLNYIKTYVYKDVPVANAQFPVLVFSHGFYSKASGYYALLSEITSHGFVIININHTYESVGSTFPDGSTKLFDQDYSLSQNTPEAWEKVSQIIEAFEQNLSFDERHSIARNTLKSYHPAHMVERWSEDISDVIDQLPIWNQRGFLKGHFDLHNIGVFGHSRGGAAAGQSLIFDQRIKAAANLDGVHWGIMVDTVYHKPFLYLSSDWSDDHQDLNQHAYVNKSTSYFYEAKLIRSGHSSFMDIPYMIRLNQINEAGEIEPNLAMKISSNLIISFFNKYLKNDSVKLETEDDTNLELKVHRGESVTKEML